MIYNNDGTFTWENEDILTAERMNKLLSQDDCGIIFLEEKREGQPPQVYHYIEASYNDLKNWMEENKIICVIEKEDYETTSQTITQTNYGLLYKLKQDYRLDSSLYEADFSRNVGHFENFDPDANLIKRRTE